MKDGELVFKGLENVRSDWTVLAKTFQYELYKKVFTGQPVEDYINSTIAAIKSGEMDHALVYKSGCESLCRRIPSRYLPRKRLRD